MERKKNRHVLFSVLFITLFFLLLFRNFLTGTSVLMTTDAIISAANRNASGIFAEALSSWDSGVLLGLPRGAATQAAHFLKACTSGILWNNLVYGLACLAASWIFLAGLGRRLSLPAVLCGTLAAFWLGSNFTLIYPGHGLKPYVVLFFVCSVFSAEVPSWRGGILWGGCTGLMFAQQPDVALFFALFGGAHLIFSIAFHDSNAAPCSCSRPPQRPVRGLRTPATENSANDISVVNCSIWQRAGRWLKVLIPAAVVAFLFAAGPLLSGYRFSVKDTAQVQTETPQEKWDYITQWSFPPDEVISFVAPGYHGWRSGEPDGPYWGRMGRSAGWEQEQQGYMNFMMESVYLGFIPVAFALFALFSCRRSKYRAEILFWGGAAAVALLLAFGKHFPLYALFYKLPVVNSIRNPNKFLQVFQVCVAILTAYGADRLLQGAGVRSQEPGDRSQRPDGKQGKLSPDSCLLTPEAKRFFWMMTAGLGILLIAALSLSLNRAESAANFAARGWPAEAARVIVNNRIVALWHAVFMAAVTAAVFAVFAFRRAEPALRFKHWIAAGLVLLIAGDALLLSRHYVQPMPRSYIEANALTDFLKKNLGTERVALLTQQGVYNVWLTYLLPYNHIPAFNFSQMPRMPEDYKKFLTAGSADPLRMWRFASVKYLLGPSGFEPQLAGQAKKVFAYNLAAAPGGEIRMIPDPAGAHAVFELAGSVSRYVLLAGAAPENDEQALARLAGRGALLNGPVTGSVEVVKYRPGRVELKTEADVPVLLRAAERWDPDWKAAVDGEPEEVLRTDVLCQGVALPAGTHSVTLSYSPSRLFLYMQCAGYAALLAAGLWSIRRKQATA